MYLDPHTKRKLELERLLKMRFERGSRHAHNPIGQALEDAWVLYALGERDKSNLVMSSLKFLTLDLQRLEQKAPELLRRYRKRLDSAGTTLSFHGVRFELKVASLLIKNRVEFFTPEPPDFTIAMEDHAVHVECGSVHIVADKGRDLWYKVVQELRSKSIKEYARKDSALFVDITNLAHYGFGMQSPTGMQELKPRLAALLPACGFGSVLLFYFALDRLKNVYYSLHIRQDDRSISPILQSFLDRVAPFQTLRVNFPSIGKEA